MTNNEFMFLVREVLKKQLGLQNLSNVRLMQGWQGKKTQTPNEPVLVFHRVSDDPVHWQYRNFNVRSNGSTVVTESQNFITTFQVNALVPRVKPEDEQLTDMSSEDLLRKAQICLQSRAMLEACKAAGLGLLPVTSWTPNWVRDEHDNWIAEPSFNLSIASKEQLSWETPAIDEWDWHIYPV